MFFITPQRNPTVLSLLSPVVLSSLSLSNHISIDMLILEISYKWNLNNMPPFVHGFFQLAKCFQGSSML